MTSDVQMFPELFNRRVDGKTQFWRMYVQGDKYWAHWGTVEDNNLIPGKPTVATAKNKGRSNATTPEQQAIKEATSAWTKKQERETFRTKDIFYASGLPAVAPHSVPSSLPSVASVTQEMKSLSITTEHKEDPFGKFEPMLANKFVPNKVKYPAAVSPKLDGVRVTCHFHDNEPIFLSRNLLRYHGLTDLEAETRTIFERYPGQLILDGEMYLHGMSFNQISGLVRQQTQRGTVTKGVLEYWIFDCYFPSCPDLTYEQRMGMLAQMNVQAPHIRLLGYEYVQSQTDVDSLHGKYVEQGFEGLIFRNLQGKYAPKKRSNDVLKFKNFTDEEFPIVDVISGEGAETGLAIYVVQFTTTVPNHPDAGKTFTVRPRGTHEERARIFNNKDKYIGKKLTVRHQALVNDIGLPRFPVGIAVRDYE